MGAGQDARDNRHVRQQRETQKCDAGGICLEALARSSAVFQAQCDAPFHVGHRRCRRRGGGMSISSSLRAPFPAVGSVQVDPEQSRWTSHKHCRMPHCRSVFHWWDMSRNQPRTMESTWILRDLLVCERSGDDVSWLPPARPLLADIMRELMLVEDVLLKSAFPQLLPAGASVRPACRRARRSPDELTRMSAC